MLKQETADGQIYVPIFHIPKFSHVTYVNKTLSVFLLLKLFNYTFKHVEEQYGHEMMKNRMDRFFTRVSYV